MTQPAPYADPALTGDSTAREWPLHASEEQQMSERVVLVTGALAGIGRATATAFARQGAAVVVSGRRDEEGKAFAAELRELGAEAEYIRADVSIEDDVQALVDGADFAKGTRYAYGGGSSEAETRAEEEGGGAGCYARSCSSPSADCQCRSLPGGDRDWRADSRRRGESTNEAGGGGFDCFDREEIECVAGADHRRSEGTDQQGEELLAGCAGGFEVWRC